MQGAPEQFENYLKDIDPNNDRECVSLGWETFIKKHSLFKEFPEMLESDLGIPKGMESNAMGELLQVLKEIKDIRDLKGEEFVESWLYHQIGQFLGLTIGDLFVSVLPQIKRICNDDKARQQYLKELCSRNNQKKTYQDLVQKIQISSIYSQLNKPPLKNEGPSESQLQSQVLLIENMHKDLQEEWDQVKDNINLVQHRIIKMMLDNFQSRNHKILGKTVFKQSQRNTKIQDIKYLGFKIKHEGSMSKQAEHYFQKCKQFFSDKDNNSHFYDNLEALKKQISIVDDFLLKKLMEETKKQNVQGKDIIFLIGPTGAGKTTLILWLLGYKMVFKNWGQFKNLTPQGQTKPEHQALLANPGSKSVTRFIYSTKLPYPGRSQLQICDSPGFFDSASTEVDIVNGIGMINAIKKCKSVKPVIVFNGQALGNRWGAVKDLGKIVSKLFSVTDFIEVKYSIQFIFNKFTKNVFQQFKAGVKQIIDSLTASDQGDYKYVGFLKHLDETLSKSEDPNIRLIFTPQSNQIIRQKWIMRLKQSPVTQPEEIFQYSYSPQSKQKIQKAAQKLSKQIIDFIGGNFKDNIKNVFYYFKKLTRIYDIVTADIKHIYDQIVRKLEVHYQQLFDRFSKHLKDQVMINEANAKTFESMKKMKEEIQQFYKIFAKSLNGLQNPNKLEQLIKQQEKNLQHQFEEVNFEPDMDETKLKMNLEVVKKSICFSTGLKKNIQDIFDKRYQSANGEVIKRIAKLSFQNFQEAGQRYLKICKWKSLWEDREEDYYEKQFYDKINRKLQDQKAEINEFIQKKISRVGKQGVNLQIHKISFDQLIRYMQKFKTLESCSFLEGTICKEINQEILKVLIEEGGKIMQKVESILHGAQINDASIDDIRILIKNRDKLVAIDGVSTALKYQIQNCNDSMRRICQSQEKAISGILASLRDETLTQNLGTEVARSYQRIRSLPSLSTDQAFIQKVNEVQKGLRDKMLLYLSEVIQKIKRLNRFNIGDKKMIQTERIKSTINQKKKIDFFSSFGLFKDEKDQIENIQTQINHILRKPFEDMKSALQALITQMAQPQEEDRKISNLISITLSKYENFLHYRNTFMEVFWDNQSNKLVGDIMGQINTLSKQFFELFIKPIRQVLMKTKSLEMLCDPKSKQLNFLERSLKILRRLKESSQLTLYLQEQIGFYSQHENQNVEHFIQKRKQELRFSIQKASREQNQKQMVNYLQYAKTMQIFDKLIDEGKGEAESFEYFKIQIQSKIKNVKQTSIKNFDDLIHDEDGLDLKQIQFFYDKFKNNWKIKVSTSKTQGTEAQAISGQMVSKLHKYFKNQQRILGRLLGRMLLDTSNISLFSNQETSGYLAKVGRIRKQISQIIQIFENQPVRVEFESYLAYLQKESLIEYQKEIDGQITEITERIEEFRLKEIKNRLRKFKEVENQIRNTMVPQCMNQRLVRWKENVKKDSKIGEEQRCSFVYEYLQQYYRSNDKKRLQILQLENRQNDLSIKGIANIYNELQLSERENFKARIENLLTEMQQQIETGWKLGKKMIPQKNRLNEILKNIPNEIRSKFSRDLEQSKKNIEDKFTKFEKQIITKISEDRFDFQMDLIRSFKQIQESADANLLEKYVGFTRQYFKKHQAILSRTSTVSQLLNIFQEKIIALKPLIFQNDNRLQQIKTQYIDCEGKIVGSLSQLLRKKNIKNVQTYLQKGKISGFGSIEGQIKQIFVAYEILQNHLYNNNKFQEQVKVFLKSISRQYEKFTIEWQRDVNIEFDTPKKVLIQKLTKYLMHFQVVSIVKRQIQSNSQFFEIYDVLANDKIKEMLNVLGQKTKDLIVNIQRIKFYSDELKSMNQIQVTKYLQGYQRDFQKLKKFKQIFVDQLGNLMQVPIKIQQLQDSIIGQWQRQNNSILCNIEHFLQDFDKDISDVSNQCNVLDLVFKVVRQKKIYPLWKKCQNLNQLSLTKELQKFISELQNKCSQSFKDLNQATQKAQKEIIQEDSKFIKLFKQIKDRDENNNREKIDRSQRQIQADTSLKPEEKNQKIQALIDNIQKLSNDKLREMKSKHESLMNTKKKKIIQSQEGQLRDIALNLVKIKRISFYVRKFSKANHEWMNIFLKQLSYKSRQKMVYLEKYLRETKAEVEVEMIINDSGAFSFIKAEKYVRQTKAQDIQYLLREIPQIKQNISLADKYRRQYKYYLEEYSRIQEDYKLDSTGDFKRLLAEDIKKKGSQRQYKKSVLVAKIFGLWSILKLDDDQSEIVFSFNPHPAQIMAILFLINCLQGKEKMKNRFAEVLTGEGKSVVLAGLCSYLAVCGYKAYCACYSEYLSMRDNQEFKILFNYLGILDKVKYGPFNVHCQDFLNTEGAEKTFKESIKQFIINQQSFLDKLGSFFGSFFESLANKFTNKDKLQKRVLIIDEVDVFFDEKFYGQIYRPAITLDSEQIQNLLLQVWQLKKSDKLSTKEIQKSEWFIKTIKKYPQLQNLLKNQLNGMIRAAEDPSHSYIVNNECLCYIDNQSISYEINYGFKTVFANCLQFDRKRVSLTNRNKSLKISLIVCQFSYAELPKYFKVILGVSGTINAIPQYKKTDMRDIYDIKEFISIPSIYRKKKVTESYQIVKNESFDKILSQHIQKVYKQSRPVIVFFSGVREMYRYRSCPQFNHLKSLSYILSEETENDHRDQIIQRAGQKGLITLITSSFARGTDFKIYEKSVIEAGGLHVIQTYLSMNESDFIQVKGRTARQGKDGSFEFLLKESDLELLEIKYDERLPIPDQLRRAWKLNDKKIGETYKQKLIKATEKHNQNVGRFSKNASQAQWIKYILNLNGYEEIKYHHVRTMIGIDGTGSMSYALKNVLLTIERVVQRISAIVLEQKFNGSQEIEIAIYRNYNSDYDLLLQSSGFQSSATKLTEFLRKISASGGNGRQAVEVFFQYVNKRESVNQVIVIGDAAPNTRDEVISKRRAKPESYWNQHKFPMTTSEAELEIIKRNKIPVHSFYLQYPQYFQQLSKDTGGHSEQFVLNSPNTEKSLIDFFSAHILKALDPSEKLLNVYAEKYEYRKRY